ncbi:MAG: FeoA family protein [Spirulinaceae cyanobacterium]
MEQISTHLRDMEIGSVVTIVGYDKAYGGYQGKLTSIGLTPNTELTLLHLGCPDAPIEIKVGTTRLSLSQQEADALLVEEAE